jgi:hypothetical protein
MLQRKTFVSEPMLALDVNALRALKRARRRQGMTCCTSWSRTAG